MSFTVFKSSAGSGKTYTLVREYLKLVLSNPANFRHVLAITFTNKAANEMKERIVRVLKALSDHDLSAEEKDGFQAYIEDLSGETGIPSQTIVENAKQVLNSILHSYSDFAVSTIDSFIHRVIRSFAFDLNVPVNFEVELDTDEVLKQVIDILISRVGSDPVLTRFMVDFVQSRAEEEKNWNVEDDLLKVARLIKREHSTGHLERNAGLEIGDYMKMHGAISKFLHRYEQNIQVPAREAITRIGQKGIPASAFYQGERGVYGYFRKIAEGNFDAVAPNTYVQKTFDEDKWSSGKAGEAEKQSIAELVPDLTSLYTEIRREAEKQGDDYILFSEIRKTLYPLAFLGKVNQVLDEFKAENNILLIAEFNQLISTIVLDEPVPFIYERVGEKYRHFLLDEFQDTSVLQWQNLLPLLENSLAQGFSNLLVGDAKQAIYRWRNGEVEQFVNLPGIYGRKEGPLHEERERMLTSHYVGRELDHNYRSRPGIVGFNNDLFRWLSSRLPEREALIYSQLEQKAASREPGGFARLEFFPPGRDDISFDDHNCTRVLEIIREVSDAGYRYEDMAILCRTNKAAGIIAKHLLKHGVQVVSSESMLLQSAPVVRLLTGVMTLLVDPANAPAVMEVVNLLNKLGKIPGPLHQLGVEALSGKLPEGAETSTPPVFRFLRTAGFPVERRSMLALPLYDLVEALTRTFGLDESTDPFVQFFLDLVLEREQQPETGVRQFLDFWERKKHAISIVVPEGLDAVRIMTIHKAKGLEFPVVICPFLNDYLGTIKDPLWMELDNPEVEELRSVLVNANKTVRETRYGGVVEQEVEKIQLDMVNLLYVAFTRPTDELYVIANHPSNLQGSEFSIPALLLEYLEEKTDGNEDPYIFSIGERVKPTKPDDTPGRSMEVDRFHSSDWRSRALVSYQSPSNWEVDEPSSRQEWGNLIHRILSGIMVADDLPPVLEDLHEQGVVDTGEKQLLMDLISEFLERPEVHPYFQPGLTVWTEAEIIAPGGGIYRPDRIIDSAGRQVIIDFKTGSPSEKHRLQMQQYRDLILAMSGKPAKGVVLYLDAHTPLIVE